MHAIPPFVGEPARGSLLPRTLCDTTYHFGVNKFRLRIKIIAPCDCFGVGEVSPYAAIGMHADTRLPPLRASNAGPQRPARGSQLPRTPCDTAYRFGGKKFRLRIKSSPRAPLCPALRDRGRYRSSWKPKQRPLPPSGCGQRPQTTLGQKLGWNAMGPYRLSHLPDARDVDGAAHISIKLERRSHDRPLNKSGIVPQRLDFNT